MKSYFRLIFFISYLDSTTVKFHSKKKTTKITSHTLPKTNHHSRTQRTPAKQPQPTPPARISLTSKTINKTTMTPIVKLIFGLGNAHKTISLPVHLSVRTQSSPAHCDPSGL